MVSVGIVVLAWNEAEETAACLGSLSRIDFPEATVLVVDNGSQEDIGAALKKSYPYVQVVRLPRNLGFAGGMNAGLKWFLDKGFPYVLLLNNDTRVDPHFLTALVQAMDAHPHAAAANPKIFFADHPHDIWFAGGVIRLPAFRTIHRGYRETDHGQYDQMTDMDYLTGCCMLLRSSVLKSTGLLDPVYFNQCEDVDLSLRLRRVGHDLLFVPAARIFHRVSFTIGGELAPMNLYYGFRNNLRIVFRFRRRPVALLYHAVLGPVSMTLKMALRRNGPAVRAILMGVRDFFLNRGGEGAGTSLYQRRVDE